MGVVDSPIGRFELNDRRAGVRACAPIRTPANGLSISAPAGFGGFFSVFAGL